MSQYNVKYQCDNCHKISYRSLGGTEIECSCGGTLRDTAVPMISETRKQLIDSSSMLSIRKECLSRRTQLMQHIYHCKDCGNIHTQNDYSKSVKCSCGKLMPIELTIFKGIEYDGQSGISLQELLHLSNNALNENIVTAKRKALGLTQSQFGFLYGISQSMVAKLETGIKKIPDALVIKLTQV
jgi:Helix-turn-helix.